MPEIEAPEIWTEPLDWLMVRLGTASAGLRAREARQRLAIYGPNDPMLAKRTPPWLQFLARFRNPLIIILVVASALSAAAGDVTSFLIVVTIIALSTSLDFLREFRAHNAVDALRRSVAVRASVRRDGMTSPAARLSDRCSWLRRFQASSSGEADAPKPDPHALALDCSRPEADRKNNENASTQVMPRQPQPLRPSACQLMHVNAGSRRVRSCARHLLIAPAWRREC